MSNGLFAGAIWRGPVPNRDAGEMSAHRGLVLHIMQGTLAGTDSWFKNPKSEVSAHFGVGKDGTIYQWVNTNDRAWAEVAGNSEWISVENEGDTGQKLTDAQMASIAKVYAWAHQQYDCKLQKTDNPAGGGLGYHAMGGDAWGNHPDCPGAPIIAQRDHILDETRKLLDVKPLPPWYSRVLRLKDYPNWMRGPDVSAVQRIVRAPEDGIYGDQTAAKVRGWQHAHGLTADGTVGPKTARAMA